MSSFNFVFDVLHQAWQRCFVGFEFYDTNMAEFLIAVLIFGIVIRMFLYIPNFGSTITKGINYSSRNSSSQAQKSYKSYKSSKGN